MACSIPAVRARLYILNRRHPTFFQTQLHPVRRISGASQYSPSNFSKPLRFRPADAASTSHDSIPSTSPGSRPSYAHPTANTQRPTETVVPGVRFTMWTAIKSLFGWKPQMPVGKPPPFHIHNNPYRARKRWPPDFNTLHPKQQFHFEKTYRRRAKLKYARPTWNKWTKLVQHTLIVFTLIYFVFICEPSHDQGTPFDGFRVWFFGKLKNLGRLPDSTKEEIERLEQGGKHEDATAS